MDNKHEGVMCCGRRQRQNVKRWSDAAAKKRSLCGVWSSACNTLLLHNKIHLWFGVCCNACEKVLLTIIIVNRWWMGECKQKAGAVAKQAWLHANTCCSNTREHVMYGNMYGNCRLLFKHTTTWTGGGWANACSMLLAVKWICDVMDVVVPATLCSKETRRGDVMNVVMQAQVGHHQTKHLNIWCDAWCTAFKRRPLTTHVTSWCGAWCNACNMLLTQKHVKRLCYARLKAYNRRPQTTQHKTKQSTTTRDEFVWLVL